MDRFIMFDKLAEAIVIQAAKDYRSALRTYKESNQYKHRHALETIHECEDFFMSDWHRDLTPADGMVILARIRQQEGYDADFTPCEACIGEPAVITHEDAALCRGCFHTQLEREYAREKRAERRLKNAVTHLL